MTPRKTKKYFLQSSFEFDSRHTNNSNRSFNKSPLYKINSYNKCSQECNSIKCAMRFFFEVTMRLDSQWISLHAIMINLIYLITLKFKENLYIFILFIDALKARPNYVQHSMNFTPSDCVDFAKIKKIKNKLQLLH